VHIGPQQLTATPKILRFRRWGTHDAAPSHSAPRTPSWPPHRPSQLFPSPPPRGGRSCLPQHSRALIPCLLQRVGRLGPLPFQARHLPQVPQQFLPLPYEPCLQYEWGRCIGGRVDRPAPIHPDPERYVTPRAPPPPSPHTNSMASTPFRGARENWTRGRAEEICSRSGPPSLMIAVKRPPVRAVVSSPTAGHCSSFLADGWSPLELLLHPLCIQIPGRQHLFMEHSEIGREGRPRRSARGAHTELEDHGQTGGS